MDLLFTRYASPFLLLDNYIAQGRLVEFVLSIIDKTNEAKIYDYWLHKVFDKSFDEFKKLVMSNNEIVEDDNENAEETIRESMNILNNFIPN